MTGRAIDAAGPDVALRATPCAGPRVAPPRRPSQGASRPGLHALTGGLPGAQRAVVAGRPVRVGRRAPDHTGRHFRGAVQGFLADHLRVYAAVAARSASERDALLSAVRTLTPDPETPDGPGASPPAA